MSDAAELRDKADRYRRLFVQIEDVRAREALVQACETLETEAARIDAEQGVTGSIRGREIYASENGDRWSLVLADSGLPRVLHQPNASSGGHSSALDLDTFLTSNGRHTPQHQALLRLVASVLGETGR